MTPENDRAHFMSDYPRWAYGDFIREYEVRWDNAQGSAPTDEVTRDNDTSASSYVQLNNRFREHNPPGVIRNPFVISPGTTTTTGDPELIYIDPIEERELYTYHSEDGDTLYWRPHEDIDNDGLWKVLGMIHPGEKAPERQLPDPSEATELNDFIEGLKHKGGNSNG